MSLKSIQQKQIEFQDEQITAVMVQDENGRENVYVPLRPLVEGMGLDWSAQYRRIKKNIVLREVCTSVVVTTTQARETLCIPISHLNGFLFGINANRVKANIRPLLLAYQQNCYRVLFDAFNGIESMTRFYQAMGHEGSWIDKRIDKHTSSTDLTDVWLIEGMPIESHGQLHDIISQGTFGVTVSEHKQLKGINADDSLPDNMTKMELLVSAIADETAAVLSQDENETDYADVAKRAGAVGKGSAKLFEETTGRKILSKSNNLGKRLADRKE
ncbi:MAG: phage antirepressor N-terminal domain-containing protein [Chloroflexota bacterium]